MISETTKTEIVTETELLAACNLDDSECTLTDDFLTDNFVMAGEDGTVALSRPASKASISVKDKQKKAATAQTTNAEEIDTKEEEINLQESIDTKIIFRRRSQNRSTDFSLSLTDSATFQRPT